ncbi:MAG: four helix bundle protein [Sedimentisphaerales bacterium]|nr:four helix bundle protein [Sedimentisphaerales bacterium]
MNKVTKSKQVKTYRDMIVWQKAMTLVTVIYRISKKRAFDTLRLKDKG